MLVFWKEVRVSITFRKEHLHNSKEQEEIMALKMTSCMRLCTSVNLCVFDHKGDNNSITSCIKN